MTRVFISSVQKEFAAERKALCKYIREDVLLCKFFEPFLFEELPATNMSAQEAYLKEAAESEIYLGIYGNEYGYEDEQGVSPTEREYDTAVANGRHRLIFVKRSEQRSPKETAFVKRVESQVVRKAFNDYEELKTNVYASLVRFLEDNGYLHSLPWDATYHREATLDDIDSKKVESFIALAREKRKSKLTFDPDNILGALHQLNLASTSGQITNAALLLFGKNPQGFFRPSEVKCMLFPSPLKRKPILSYQVYEGGLFEMIDSAVGFVMQHIDAYVGTHTQASVDVIYEIPYEAVLETIVKPVHIVHIQTTAAYRWSCIQTASKYQTPVHFHTGLPLTSLHNFTIRSLPTLFSPTLFIWQDISRESAPALRTSLKSALRPASLRRSTSRTAQGSRW